MYNLSYNFVPNYLMNLVDDFLNGEEFTMELCDKIFSTFDKLDNTSYVGMLEHVKKLLNNLHKTKVYDVFVLKCPYELSPKEKAALVRFINISHKGNKNIIILNNDVLFIGSEFDKYDIDLVKKYIDKVTGELYAHDSFNSFKNKVKSLKKKLLSVLTFPKFKLDN